MLLDGEFDVNFILVGNCLNIFLGELKKDTFQCQKLNLLIVLNLEFIWLLMGYVHKLKENLIFVLQDLLFPLSEMGKLLQFLASWEDPFKSRVFLFSILFLLYR